MVAAARVTRRTATACKQAREYACCTASETQRPVQDDLALALWEAAKPAGWRVRQFVMSGAAPFSTTAAAMAATGVLVGRHGVALASAALLPPGAAVYELLPFNWEWEHLAELYRNLTRSTGHLHHFAWRPTDSKWAVYASEGDKHMYSAFRASECTSKCASSYSSCWAVGACCIRSVLACTKITNSVASGCMQAAVWRG